MKPPMVFLASLSIPLDVKSFTVLNDNAMPSKLPTTGAWNAILVARVFKY